MIQVPRGRDCVHLCRRIHSSPTEYRACLVDYGASRAVHCPELNACFIENCNVVHYGYAIPISVLPVDENHNLVELVFDSAEAIDPVVASYLLANHPDFKCIREGGLPSLDDGNIIPDTMETMAKHDHMRKFTEPEEDIAAIAKQISDHAEAIYQTWKSRGLAPTEILTCHSNATAADKFGTALTPKSGTQKSLTVGGGMRSPTSSPALDPDNIERFVNTFVVEDKARLAAEKAQTPTQKSRSIQYALQKFEKNTNATDYPKSSYRPAAQPTQISRPIPANQIQLQTLDTIEVMLPEEIVRKEAPQAPKRLVEFEGTNSNHTGVPTWPLKNKSVDAKKEAARKLAKNSEEYLDEVRREEERLINALKCGVIINEESTSPVVDDSVTNAKCPNTALKKAVLDTISGRNPAAGKKEGGFSLVDYAKIRYKNAQENPLTQQRLEQSKEFDKVPTSRSQVISAAKTRFELRSAKTSGDETSTGTAWRSKEEKDWMHAQAGDVVDDVDRGKAGKGGRTRHTDGVPHPELTSQQRQHLRQSGNNPVRPFLTRGSVAERVLIFEKCPSEFLLDKRRNTPAISTWRTGSEVQSKAQGKYKRRKAT